MTAVEGIDELFGAVAKGLVQKKKVDLRGVDDRDDDDDDDGSGGGSDLGTSYLVQVV